MKRKGKSSPDNVHLNIFRLVPWFLRGCGENCRSSEIAGAAFPPPNFSNDISFTDWFVFSGSNRRRRPAEKRNYRINLAETQRRQRFPRSCPFAISPTRSAFRRVD